MHSIRCLLIRLSDRLWEFWSFQLYPVQYNCNIGLDPRNSPLKLACAQKKLSLSYVRSNLVPVSEINIQEKRSLKAFPSETAPRPPTKIRFLITILVKEEASSQITFETMVKTKHDSWFKIDWAQGFSIWKSVDHQCLMMNLPKKNFGHKFFSDSKCFWA